MITTKIEIWDALDNPGHVNTKIHYDIPDDTDLNVPLSNATVYGFLINYLFQTGKINDYWDEAVLELKRITDGIEV